MVNIGHQKDSGLSGVRQGETPHSGRARFSQCHGASLEGGACRVHVVYKQYLPSLNSWQVQPGSPRSGPGVAGEGIADVDLSFKGIQPYLNPGAARSPECAGHERQAHHLAKGMG